MRKEPITNTESARFVEELLNELRMEGCTVLKRKSGIYEIEFEGDSVSIEIYPQEKRIDLSFDMGRAVEKVMEICHKLGWKISLTSYED